MFGKNLFGKGRVEEDLARIRHANLPEKYPDPARPPAKRSKRSERPERPEAEPQERIGAKDVLAMIIAVFSILAPYVAAFIAIMGLIVWGFTVIF